MDASQTGNIFCRQPFRRYPGGCQAVECNRQNAAVSDTDCRRKTEGK
ncbi:MAG: hypothetical protein K2P45_04700 [Eubacterium sp.]|nr:hypothetical protein [Eubacterium sp.]